MDNETITDILDQLDEREKKFLKLAGALPKELAEQYELETDDVAQLVEAVSEE